LAGLLLAALDESLLALGLVVHAATLGLVLELVQGGQADLAVAPAGQLAHNGARLAAGLRRLLAVALCFKRSSLIPMWLWCEILVWN